MEHIRNTTIMILLTTAVALAASACSSAKGEYLIGVSQCSDDSWRDQMNMEIRREVMSLPGVEVEIRSADDDNSRQISDIEYFMAKGADVLVIAPNEADAIAPAVEKVYDSGIPVILVDRKINSEKYTAYVGADNREIGREIGRYVSGRLGGRGRIAELRGLAGSTPAKERHDGLMESLAGEDGIAVAVSADAGWSYSSAKAVFDSILNVCPEIDMVIAHNDMMAAGARDAAAERGMEGNMLFVGVDAIAGDGLGLDMVRKGILDASFIYPTGGDKVVQAAIAALEKRPFPRETLLSTALVNGNNARIMQMQNVHIDALDKKIENLNVRLDNAALLYASYRIYFIICLSLLLAVVVLLVFLGRERARLKARNEEIERQRNQSVELSRRLEEATRAKITFFTNVSHDFRTPLTLIADPVRQLMSDGKLGEHEKFLLGIIDKNVLLLLRLVNQIMDFRKYESGNLNISMEPFDACASVRNWAESFRSLSFRKHIKFSVSVPGTECRVVSDKEKVERILYNLLSNAFRFTGENGEVSVNLSFENFSGGGDSQVPSAGIFLVLEVSDTGVGMSAEHISHIFENFYQADVHHSGSGIGLAIVKAFTEALGGTVGLKSIQGRGTTFTVRIPVDRAPAAEDGEEADSVADPPGNDALPLFREGAVADADAESIGVSSSEHLSPSMKTVLVVEDNKDVREYLKSLLGGEYNVIEASDGSSGVRLAAKYVPDAVICDVMMPVMDGMECCRRIKENFATSHVPVMMLTAYSMDEQKIKGYECGADSYISKPFSSALLKTRLKNLIDNRKRLYEYFEEGGRPDSGSVSSDMDRDFLGRLRAKIEENLSDPSFSVEDLGESIGLSRAQLYRKTKSLTSYSPNELLRITRLKKAAAMLSSSERTVAEVAYGVGFNSPAYFARCYREYFGISPAESQKQSRR